MLSAKDVGMVYETLLTSPGMNDTVKIVLNIPRKDVLLLSKIIELGLSIKEDAPASLLNAVDKDSLSQLNSFTNDLLQKAGLTEMYTKLNALQSK